MDNYGGMGYPYYSKYSKFYLKMKTTIYLRVAKKGAYGKVKVSASTHSSEDPIFLPKTYGREKEAIPTIGFAVIFEIPDELFSKASVVVATINLPTKSATILSGLPVIAKKK